MDSANESHLDSRAAVQEVSHAVKVSIGLMLAMVFVAWILVMLIAPISAEFMSNNGKFLESEGDKLTLILFLMGLPMMLFLYSKRLLFKEFFNERVNKMTMRIFIQILLVIVGIISLAQTINVLTYGGISDWIEGQTPMTPENMFYHFDGLQFAMICIILPIVEGILYRGYLFNRISQYSIGLAIASIGVLHSFSGANVVMMVFAYAIGIILTYVNYRYGLKWSIVLDCIATMVVIGIGRRILMGQEISIMTLTVYILGIVSMLASLTILWIHRDTLKAQWLYFNQEPLNYKLMFKSKWLMFLIIFGIFVSIIQ